MPCFHYLPAQDQATRDAVFVRMSAEGLLGCAMSAFAAPSLDDWQRITDPAHGVLLCCYPAAGGHDPAAMLACALFTPRRGKLWEFDFTTFRAAARLAVPMARDGLAWAFTRLDCAAVLGLCPAPNRHAWRLAQACGFRLLARLPQACRHARKNRFVDGVLVCCTPSDLRNVNPKEALMGFGGGSADTPSVPEVTPVPKQEVQKPVTEAATAARQIQKDKAAGDKQSVAELEAKKAELQELLDKKKTQAAKKKLNAQKKKLEQQIGEFPVKTYSGIWQADVTTADWAAKAGSIQAKKEYFESKLLFGSLTPEETAKFKGLLQDLEEFDTQGQQLHELQKKQKNVQESLSKLKNGGKEDPNPYSEARKDAALWAQTPQEADDVLREKCGEVWRKASKAEKDALYAYTQGSGGFNRPLRGHDGYWGNFKGVGKVDLNNEGRGAAIQHMTNVINRSTYDKDIWLQRGIETAEGAASFLGIPVEALHQWSVSKLKKLEGEEIVEPAFASCGSAKGQGFSGYIFRIYCPKGTKMMYAEPFSHYGAGGKRKWDGKKTQTSFGYEDETIIQRGTKFRIMKVEKSGYKVSFEIAVIEQI